MALTNTIKEYIKEDNLAFEVEDSLGVSMVVPNPNRKDELKIFLSEVAKEIDYLFMW